MTFISYAQNYEDVMLWRAFKDIKKGFYIDVGANDPVIDSVTKAFYDAGWHGINIEPVTEWHDKLQEARPNDINLKLACGTRKGQNTIYDVVGTGLSTMDKSIADKHANELDFEIKKEKIEVDSLTNICKQYANQDIHFLKIDVEGFELQVLKGLDLKKIRPWIIVIEATLPNSQIEDYGKWDGVLTNGQYNFVYFDGLNRFYVASEHDELNDSFNVPPNYFDFFRRSSEQWALDELKVSEQKVYAKEDEISLIAKDLDIANKELSEQSANIGLLKGELKASEQKIYELNQSSHHWWLESERLNEELQSVYSSKSWKITWPLRKLMQLLKWIFIIPVRIVVLIVYSPKNIVKWVLIKFMRFVISRPVLKSRIKILLYKYPKLGLRLRRLAMARGIINKPTEEQVRLHEELSQFSEILPPVSELSQLTISAKRTYKELKSAIENNEKGGH